MSNLSTKIKIYAANNGVSEVDFMKDVMLQDDSNGEGPYIKEWNLDIAQPTTEQLDAYEATAADEEYNKTQIAKRVAEYGSAAEQLEIIVEQGADALASRNNAIKAKYPKK
jgi:hypothetical protein